MMPEAHSAANEVSQRSQILKKKEVLRVGRRDFLACSSFLVLGAGYLDASSFGSQVTPTGPELPEELSPDELEFVKSSVMGTDFENYFGQSYSCSESGLMVALRYMEKPEELVWAAGGFGGGLGREDLCGFLTGGSMAIGFYSGMLELEREEATTQCKEKIREFWDWWTTMAPLHCYEIREGREDYKVCHRLGKLAAARVEELITPRD